MSLSFQMEQSTQSRSFGVLIGSRDPEEVKKEKIDKLNATIEDVRIFGFFQDICLLHIINYHPFD